MSSAGLCGGTFVDDPQWRVIANDTKALIDLLRHERISLCRKAGSRHMSTRNTATSRGRCASNEKSAA
jgi:hypothetical protein